MFLLVDVETSGTDPDQDHLVEVAGVLFDPDQGVPVMARSAVVRAEGNAAAALNRIPEPILAGPHCLDPAKVGAWYGRFGDGHTFVAHNAEFDRQWLRGVGDDWICSYQDASWPRMPTETGSLTAIALAYDVGVVRAHRAIEDCLTLAAVLARVHEIEGGLDGWLARAREPKHEVIALVSYDDRQLAKDAGFRWDPDRKVWSKLVRESVLDEYCGSLPFRVRGRKAA